MKAKLILFVSVVSIFVSPPVYGEKQGTTPAEYNENFKKISQQNQVENEGRKLIEQGLYDKAIEKFKKADDPSLRVEGYERSLPKGLLAKAYQFSGKYEDALAIFNYLLSLSPNQVSFEDGKLELEALIKARETKSPHPVNDHIQYLKEKYKDQLPPKRYQSTGYSTVVTSDIIRLYDHIADYDAGIAFVDSVVNYFYSKNKSLRGVSTSQEALQKAEERGKHWRDYKKIYEYLKVREAFEADKKEGRQSCVGKTGVCIGRATQALIQSDYFPW